MMDDVAAVLELCCDEAAMEGDAQRRLFVKTVLANLSKEAPIPVFLTDLLHCAIKASVVRGLRGVPLVVYERLTLDAFARELQLPKKTSERLHVATLVFCLLIQGEAELDGSARLVSSFCTGWWVASQRLPTRPWQRPCAASSTDGCFLSAGAEFPLEICRRVR